MMTAKNKQYDAERGEGGDGVLGRAHEGGREGKEGGRWGALYRQRGGGG
jgi:hypothetical protein